MMKEQKHLQERKEWRLEGSIFLLQMMRGIVTKTVMTLEKQRVGPMEISQELVRSQVYPTGPQGSRAYIPTLVQENRASIQEIIRVQLNPSTLLNQG